MSVPGLTSYRVPVLYFVTGASGSGKSTLVRRLRAEEHARDASFFEFDSIGVPSVADMVATCGSPEEWQRRAAARWVARLVRDDVAGRARVLDGQIRLSFIDGACRAAGVRDHRIVLVDCGDAVRSRRLVGRGQSELATDAMNAWASYLRREAQTYPRARVLDTSSMTVEEATARLAHLLDMRRP